MKRFRRYLRDVWWFWTEGFDKLRQLAAQIDGCPPAGKMEP